ncbi:MAG: hypothetical protein ACI81I_000310 [Arcobacteraceae bacterium]|jgi:hypothetical protein
MKKDDKFHYPYIRNSTTLSEENEIATYIKSKFVPHLRKTHPLHPLVSFTTIKMLDFWYMKSKSHPYYLKFDIMKFYVCVDHEILCKVILEVYEKIYKKKPPVKLIKVCTEILPIFLNQSIHATKSIPLSSSDL